MSPHTGSRKLKGALLLCRATVIDILEPIRREWRPRGLQSWLLLSPQRSSLNVTETGNSLWRGRPWWAHPVKRSKTKFCRNLHEEVMLCSLSRSELSSCHLKDNTNNNSQQKKYMYNNSLILVFLKLIEQLLSHYCDH